MSVPVADDGPAFVTDYDAAVLPDVAVFGGGDDLLADLPLEALCVVAHLQKPAVFQRDPGIFAGERRVIGGGLVALDDGRRTGQQRQKFRRLLTVGHIIAHKIRIGAGRNDAAAVHQIDF